MRRHRIGGEILHLGRFPGPVNDKSRVQSATLPFLHSNLARLDRRHGIVKHLHEGPPSTLQVPPASGANDVHVDAAHDDPSAMGLDVVPA